MCTEVTYLLIGSFKLQSAICRDSFRLAMVVGDGGMVVGSV